MLSNLEENRGGKRLALKNAAERKEKDLNEFLELIGNDTRRAILNKISKVPLSVSELAEMLKISRQAVHSQMELLKNFGLVEEFEMPEKRGKAYKIKDNISLSINISPNYFSIKHNLSKEEKEIDIIEQQTIEICSDLDSFKSESEKIQFLGREIQELDKQLNVLDQDRNEIILRKECLLRQAKDFLYKQYEEKLTLEFRNQGKEILSTFFFNPEKFFGRFDIDNLINEMFFSGGPIQRRTNKSTVEGLLDDMAKMLDFLRKDKDDFWFFEF